MLQSSQFVAGGAAEVGVLSQYVDGELYLVDNTLPGTMPTVEKFQVGRAVITADSINVMDSFFGQQVSPDYFGHDVTMFHDGVLFAGDETRNRNPNIAVALDVSAKFAAIKFVQRLGALMRGFTFLIAIFLIFVYSSARFATLRIFVSTRDAAKCLFGITGFSTAYARALTRAIQRVSFIFFMVRGNKILHHGKTPAAFLAGKIKGGSALSRNSFTEAVRAPAREAAVFSVFTWEAGKRLLAVFTDFLNRHNTAPLFGNKGIMSLSVENVK